MANTALESVGKDYAFMPVVRTFFSTFIEHLAAIYAEKHPEPEARLLAVRAVQEIEGAILLTRIFGEKTYLLQAIQRLVV
jgi:TetR/AcrR family transcriptional repressor of nem operon